MTWGRNRESRQCGGAGITWRSVAVSVPHGCRVGPLAAARPGSRFWMWLGAFLLLLPFATRRMPAQTEQPEGPAITRTVQDASRALQARNAARFLGYFDRKRFSAYSEIEASVVALAKQADIASSIAVSGWEREGEEYLGTVDWILQLTLISAPGEVRIRRETIRFRMARSKNRWKIVELSPVSFFRPW